MLVFVISCIPLPTQSLYVYHLKFIIIIMYREATMNDLNTFSKLQIGHAMVCSHNNHIIIHRYPFLRGCV